MLQDLLSNPGVVSVESLERAQREESRTPPSEMPPMPLQATKADDLEADLKNKLQVPSLDSILFTQTSTVSIQLWDMSGNRMAKSSPIADWSVS